MKNVEIPQTLGSWAVTLLGLALTGVVFRLGWELGGKIWAML